MNDLRSGRHCGRGFRFFFGSGISGPKLTLCVWKTGHVRMLRMQPLLSYRLYGHVHKKKGLRMERLD